MMEETFLLDYIKEQVCFVSTDLAADFARTKAGQLKLDYVLPDGVNDLKGYVRAPLPPGERRDPNSHEQVFPFFSLLCFAYPLLSLPLLLQVFPSA